MHETKAMLEKALELCVTGHAGQKSKDGEPYAFHPIRLMQGQRSPEGKMVALMHDLVEDTELTLEDLAGHGFPDEVVEAIGLLTHPEDMPPKTDPGFDEAYLTYVRKLSANPLARSVKLADLADNMNVRRLDELKDKDLARLGRYHASWKLLTEL